MPCSIHNEEERLRNGPVSEDYNEKERTSIIYPRPEDILCEERGGTENILSAVLRRGDDSVNTTIFLELILVIVGETFKFLLIL